jgi:hypothetical protein
MLVLAVLTAAERAGAQDAPQGRAVIAILPYGTEIEEIAAVPGIAPGLVSAGLGAVPVAQTYLDIGQGNRVNERLYDGDLPRLFIANDRVPSRLWRQVVERASGAPADIVPGLLGSTLADAGIPVTVEAASGLATLAGVDRDGTVPTQPPSACDTGCDRGLSVVRTKLAELAALARTIGPSDLLVAIASGARTDQQLLPTGVVGEGFEGNLTSATTRTDGVITTTDIAPTVLDHFGLATPDEMNGNEIVAEGETDPAAVAELQDRLADRPSRDLVALLPLGIWAVAAALAALGGRAALRHGVRLVGLACAWAPFMLLVAAALDADEPASAVLMGIGAPVLAGVTAVLAPGYLGLAIACAFTVGSHAADVIAGSPYTALSVLGPNPGGGTRFFGIGNELEAILTTLTLVGAGAWLATRQELDRRAAAAWFLAIAGLAAAAFAPGRFGADVGAAIVLGVGGATAAALALGWGKGRTLAAVVAAGVLGLGALIVIDLAFGGAHLSGSVLGAGEASDVVDVLERRVTLMANTFIHPVYPELLVASVLLLVVGLVCRDAVLGWFGDRWAARCGFVGAVTGVLVGTVANDSGSILLVLGTIYLAASAGFFWAEAGESAGRVGIRTQERRLARLPAR